MSIDFSLSYLKPICVVTSDISFQNLDLKFLALRRRGRKKFISAIRNWRKNRIMVLIFQQNAYGVYKTPEANSENF